MGSLSEGFCSATKLWALKNWPFGQWALKKDLMVLVFRRALLLFDFKDYSEVERVLFRGSRRFDGRILQLSW